MLHHQLLRGQKPALKTWDSTEGVKMSSQLVLLAPFVSERFFSFLVCLFYRFKAGFKSQRRVFIHQTSDPFPSHSLPFYLFIKRKKVQNRLQVACTRGWSCWDWRKAAREKDRGLLKESRTSRTSRRTTTESLKFPSSERFCLTKDSIFSWSTLLRTIEMKS